MRPCAAQTGLNCPLGSEYQGSGLRSERNVRPDIRPQLREYLAWYEEEVLGRVESGAVVAPGEQERLTEEASAVAHLLDLLDSSADEPAGGGSDRSDLDLAH
jgi:hypothetical protein